MKRIIIGLIIGCFGLGSYASATVPPIDELIIEIKQVHYPSNDESIYIPLKRTGNLFYIEAKIGNQVGNFILDLGAPYLVLNSTYFRDYTIDNSYSSGTLLASSGHTRRTRVKKLQFQGILHKNITADVTDLGEIENQREIKILGLFGVALFKDYILELDVSRQQLILHKTITEEIPDSNLILDVPFKLNNNVIIVNAKSNKTKLELSLDTGAESNILDNDLNASTYDGMRIVKTLSIIDGDGEQSEVLIVVMDNISIEQTKLNKMPTLIMNLKTMSRAYGHRIDGMLGYPFFAHGRVLIDFDNKRLRIVRN